MVERKSGAAASTWEGVDVAFSETVSAICDSIVLGRCDPEANELSRRRSEVVRFVVAQHGRMPDYLRSPIRLATVAFDLFGIARYGRRFHTQSQATRWRQIEVWRDGPFPPARDFIRFYESLILYRWYADHGQ